MLDNDDIALISISAGLGSGLVTGVLSLHIYGQDLVTQEDIEIMADTLRHVFYVPTCAYREAVELAKEEGSLRIEANWLEPEIA